MSRKDHIKKLYLKIFLTAPALLFLCSTFAQKKEIDSAYSVLHDHLKEDSSRVNTLLYLSSLYQASNLKNAEYLANEALYIAGKLNDPYLTIESQLQLGSVYSWSYKTTEALTIYLKAQAYAKQINADDQLQKAYNGIAYVYELENDWEKSLSYSLESLALAEKKNDPESISFSFHGLGSAYLGLGDDKNAELYLKKARVLFLQYKNLDRLGDCSLDLAEVYVNRQKYDSAKHYFDTAVVLFTQLEEPYQIADAYQQMGEMYLKRKMDNQAEVYFNNTIAKYDTTDVIEIDYALAVLGLGAVAFDEKDFAGASKIFHSEFQKLKEGNIMEQELACLEYMAQADSALGNFKEAYQHMQEYSLLYNDFSNDKKNSAIQRSLIEFDVERKDKENEELKNLNAQQHEKMALFIVAGILVLLAGVFMTLLYRQKNSALYSVKKLQQATEKQNRELAVINSVKDKLLSMIAHDVRSPLASLQNILFLTRENILNTEEFGKLSQMLEVDIRHLMSMLDNTLLWAREQMQAIKVNPVSFNLRNLSDDVIALYHQSVNSKGIRVSNLIEPDTEIISDKEIIHTVLRNLLSNAIKFTLNGNSIFLGQEKKNKKIYITVRDEGTGISDEVLKKINEKEFISMRGTNNEKGTGLGLLFSRDLLAKLGEEFIIETQPGTGTSITFSVTDMG